MGVGLLHNLCFHHHYGLVWERIQGRVCKEEDGVLWSKIFYKHIEEVSSDISPKVVKLQWHSYHVANSNDISLNCDTCNGIHLVNPKNDSMMYRQCNLLGKTTQQGAVCRLLHLSKRYKMHQ